MSRRLTLLLLFSVLLLLFAGGLLVFRLDLATILLKQQLEARGAKDPALQVTALSLDGATVEAIRLGEGDELRIGRLDLVYDWRQLGEGRLISLAIDDAVVKLDLTGGGPPLGSLQALVAALIPESQEGESGEASGPPVPPITFTGGRIEALTSQGPLTLETTGILEVGEDERMEITARLSGEGPPGRAEGKVRAELVEGRPARVIADLTLSDFTLPRVTARTALLRIDLSEHALAIDLDLETEGGKALFAFFGESERPLLDLLSLFAEPAPFDTLGSQRLTGQGALTLEDFDLPGVVSDAQADLVFDLALTDGALALELPEPAEVSGSLAAGALRQAGLPEDSLSVLLQPLNLQIARTAAASPPLILRRSDAGYELLADLKVALRNAIGSRLTAALKGELELSDHGALLSARFPEASLEAADLVAADQRLAGAGYQGSLVYRPDGIHAEGHLTIDGLDGPEATLSSGIFAGRASYAPNDLSLEGKLHLEGLAAQGYALSSADYEGTAGLKNGEVSAKGRLTAKSETLSAGGTLLEDAELELPVDLQGTLEAATLNWDSPIRLSLGGLGGLPLKTARQGLIIVSERGQADLAWRPDFSIRHDLSLSIDLGNSEVGGVQINAAPLALSLEGDSGADGGYRLKVSGESDSFSLPAYQLRASGLTLDGAIEGQEGAITLKIARLTDQRDPQILPPLAVTVEARPSERGFVFAVSASGSGNRLKASAAARLDSENGSGSASFKLAPLLFIPGALQPAEVAPLLGGLSKVQAEMRSEGKLAWNRNGLTSSSGELRLDNASMTTGAGRVEGLTTAIELTSLWPPLSAPGQKLTAKSYTTSGVTFTDLEASYRLIEGEGPFPESLPLLLVEHAQLRFGRGRFEVSEVIIDPLSDRQTATVGVEGLELKDLFDLADIEDVSGEGPMSGSVPIRILGDDVVIEDGYLESTGPGVFRIRSAEAKAALQNAGDYVDLVLQALENFQYERLSIALNKPAEGNSVLQLKVLGSNPDVLDGHPFDINLNLETDLAPLLEALTAGQRLSEELMQRIRRQRQDSSPE